MALIAGVETLVESLGAMLAWIPQIMTFGTTTVMRYVPNAYVVVIFIILVIYVVKIVLGADNK